MGGGLERVVSGAVNSSIFRERRSRSSAGAFRGLGVRAVRAVATFRARPRVLVTRFRFFWAGLARFTRRVGRRAPRAFECGDRRRLVTLRRRAGLRARFTGRLRDRLRLGAALRFLLRLDLDFAMVRSFQFDWPPISII